MLEKQKKGKEKRKTRTKRRKVLFGLEILEKKSIGTEDHPSCSAQKPLFPSISFLPSSKKFQIDFELISKDFSFSIPNKKARRMKIRHARCFWKGNCEKHACAQRTARINESSSFGPHHICAISVTCVRFLSLSLPFCLFLFLLFFCSFGALPFSHRKINFPITSANAQQLMFLYVFSDDFSSSLFSKLTEHLLVSFSDDEQQGKKKFKLAFSFSFVFSSLQIKLEKEEILLVIFSRQKRQLYA